MLREIKIKFFKKVRIGEIFHIDSLNISFFTLEITFLGKFIQMGFINGLILYDKFVDKFNFSTIQNEFQKKFNPEKFQAYISSILQIEELLTNNNSLTDNFNLFDSYYLVFIGQIEIFETFRRNNLGFSLIERLLIFSKKKSKYNFLLFRNENNLDQNFNERLVILSLVLKYDEVANYFWNSEKIVHLGFKKSQKYCLSSMNCYYLTTKI